MTEQNHTVDQSRRRLLIRAVLLFGAGIPATLLAGVYAISEAVGFNFGNFVFGLSIVTAAAWMAFSGWGERMDAARPTGELFRNSATTYAQNGSQDTDTDIPLPARLLVVLTGTVILGWSVLLLLIFVSP